MIFLRRSIAALVLVLVLAPAEGLAQAPVTTRNIHDTDPNLPELFERRAAEFAAEPIETGRIIFLGNSITEGGDWRALLGDSTVINRGISGDVTFGLLRRLDEVIQRRPSKLFILIGINDISKDIPPEVIAANYRTIIAKVREGSPETEIFMQSLLPIHPEYPGFPQHFAKVEEVYRTNRLLREVAVEIECRFINLFPVFMDAYERLDARLTYDGLHLNEQGYAVWVEHLMEMGYLDD